MNTPKFTYYVFSLKDGSLVCSGSSRFCGDYLGCSYGTVIRLEKRKKCRDGFFSSRYAVTREAVDKKKMTHEALMRIGRNTHGGIECEQSY